MLVKRVKGKIDRKGRLLLYLPDMSPGEVEVVISRKEGKKVLKDDILLQMPRHRLGKIIGTIRREDIYDDAR